MEYCPIHPDLQYIYILLDSSQKNLFKCAQCVIDEEIQNTRQLILINKVLSSDDKTMFVNWPPNNSSKQIQKIQKLLNKNQDGDFQSIKKSIQENFKQLKQDIMKSLDEQEKKCIQIVETNINYLVQFQNQYNILADKEKFKNIVINSFSNKNNLPQNLSNFIDQKYLQIQNISENLFRVYPKALVEYEDQKLKETCQLVREQIQQQITSIDELIFNIKQQPSQIKTNYNQKESYFQQQENKCTINNNTQNYSMEAILQMLNSNTNYEDQNKISQPQLNEEKEFKRQSNQQLNNLDIPDVISDQSRTNTQIQNQDFQTSNNVFSNANIEVYSNDIDNQILNDHIYLLKSQKGGAESDLEVGKNESGLPFVRYKLSGYDHSQCYLNQILRQDKKYKIRVNIQVRDPINDQYIIGLIKKENVNKLYVHQEKICFGNCSFSTVNKVIKESLLQRQQKTLQQLEIEIEIQSGTFIVKDYPNYDCCYSLQNSTFLKNQSYQSNEWVLGFFFFSGFEQINNSITITYFTES